MKEIQRYIIRQFCFDIQFPSKTGARALQDRFSKLFDREAAPSAEAVFHSLVPGDRVIRIDALTVDMGALALDRLDADFPGRFSEALETALKPWLPAVSPSMEGEPHSGADILEYYLIHGALPWWAGGEDNPVRLFEQLVAEVPLSLPSVLRRAGAQEQVRRRLVLQFPGEALHSVIRLLEPGQAPFIIRYHTDLVNIQQVQRWVQQETGTFGKDLWLFILTYLLLEMGSHFNRKSFVRRTLQEMAARYNVTYDYLLSRFYGAMQFPVSPLLNTDSILTILVELSDELPGEPEPDRLHQTGAQGVTNLKAALESVLHFLLSGHSISLPDDPVRLGGMMDELIGAIPATVRESLENAGRSPQVRSRIVYTFGDPLLHRIVRLAEPAHADLIIQYARQIEIRQQKAPVIQVEAGNFRNSVWLFILTFLWTEKGSIFNARMFLKSQLFSLSHHYQVSYGDLLDFLVYDREGEWAGLQPSTLFHLLADLRKEYRENPATESPTTGSPAAGSPQAASPVIGSPTAESAVTASPEAGSPAAGPAQQTQEAPRQSDIRLSKAVQLLFKVLRSRPAFLTNAAFLQWADRFVFTTGQPGTPDGAVHPGAPGGAVRLKEILEDLVQKGLIPEAELVALWIETLEKYGQGIAGYGEILDWLRRRPSASKQGTSGTSGASAASGTSAVSPTDAFGPIDAAIRSGAGGDLNLPFIRAVNELFMSVIKGTPNRDNFGILYREFILVFLSDRYARKDISLFFDGLLSFLSGRPGLGRVSLSWYAALLKRTDAYPPLPAELHKHLPVLQGQLRQRLPTGREPGRELSAQDPIRQPQPVSGERSFPPVEQRGTEDLYIKNAGLVLLHPLLPTLFKRLEWIQEGRFVSEAIQHRAIHLLQFLVYGTEQHPEPALVLNKLLCGLPPGDPVPLEIALSAAEKAMGGELLDVVLQQWTKLGKTSAEGLRISFLQRPGALKEKTDSWQLRVEQKGIDVLLPFLPWGIGMIRTSWMLKPLFVEWT